MGRQLIIAIVALTGLSLGPLGSAVRAIQQKSGASPSNKDSGQRTPDPADSVNAKGTFGSIAMAFPICSQRPTGTYIRANRDGTRTDISLTDRIDPGVLGTALFGMEGLCWGSMRV